MRDINNIEHLFRAHYSRMFLLAKFMLRNDEEARDVVSDVFERVLTLPSGHDTDNSADITEAYLLTATRNQCLNIIYHRSSEQRLKTYLAIENDSEISAADTAVSTPEQQELARQQQLDRIERFISEQLSPQTQRIVRMRYDESMKYNDIGTTLNISRVAVYKHLSKAIKKLKQQFNS